MAVLFVVLMHAEYYFFDPDIAYFSGGFLGVDLFFVLSGFLITRILLNSFMRHGYVHYKQFYLNRILRLFPALALLLLVYSAFSLTEIIGQAFDIEAIVAIVFYYFNWFIISTLQTPEGLGHMWSLAVEEQFYLLWPLVFAVLLRNLSRTRLMLASILALIAFTAIWRAYLWQADTSWLVLYIRTDTRIDSILMGGFLACLLHKNLLQIPHVKILSPLAAIALILSVFNFTRESPFLYMGGFTLIAILASVLIFHAVNGDNRRTVFFDWAILRWLGKISYGLYLWHMPIFSLISGQNMLGPGLWQALLSIVLLVTVTLLSWHCIERPALRWKTRL